MQMAQIIGGYSLGGADLLRRAMGKKKAEEMAEHRGMFAEGAAKNGIDEERANEMFDLMEKFAGYGFNKSHAAAYALLAYQTAWLKAHYPAEFFAANMSCAMDDSDKLKILWEDATRRNQIAVLPPDINTSDWRFAPVDMVRTEVVLPAPPPKVKWKGAVRYGLGAIKGTGEGAVRSLLDARKADGHFKGLFDFTTRVDRRLVNKRTLEAMVRAGVFDTVQLAQGNVTDRARLFASIELACDYADQVEADKHQTSLFGDAGAPPEPPPLAEAMPWSDQQKLVEEKGVFGFSLSGHLFTSVATEVRKIARTPLASLKPSRDPQTMAGVITGMRVTMGRRGRMAILTIDDSSAAQEVVVFGELFDQRRQMLVEDAVVIVTGPVRQDEFSGGLRVSADQIWTLAQARMQFVQHVRVVFEAGVSVDPEALWRHPSHDGSQGLRIQIEVRQKPGDQAISDAADPGWRGTLMLPDRLRAPADEAALRVAAAHARAMSIELVY
jgi:DNA polymerase-3 subunit alpha